MKAKKEYKKCATCSKDITGVENVTEKGVLCFKCFVSYRQNAEKEKLLKEQNRVVDEMRRKKFYCKKCNEKKNDVEVNWYHSGIMCCKCGDKLKLEEPKENKIVNNINNIKKQNNMPKECPVCHGALHVQPAGVSKSSGKPYPAFYTCPNKCVLKGMMDTRVQQDARPEGWEELGAKFGKTPLPRDTNSDVEIHAKLDKIIKILSREMPDESEEGGY